MRITVTVEDPTPEVLERLLAFTSEPGAEVAALPDTRWTPERARAYYLNLPPRAQQILRAVVAGDGWCSADVARGESGRSLRGCTGAFARRIREGALAGRWPASLPVPVETVTTMGAVVRLEMPNHGTEADPLPAFRAALSDLHGEG
ncbi:hypothetical protein OG618_36995 (plasmid) [Kitasatospora sp. NBC_01246]|uniref:hypothetical protein n=1 Tax=Kitasatospora sp. NBC_01246 TaxID=2903570 RepID=UPI002E36A795|nr:hypothetical protein [Kitasatospora sp. NBC_01246]